VELRIYSGEYSDLNYGEFGFTSGPPAPTNLTLLTDLAIATMIDKISAGGYDPRLIEDTNVTRYQIEGEKAGAFVYVLDSRDTVTESKPVVAAEQVIAFHKGKAYILEFLARPSVFDSPTLTAIRQHMFNSIRWR